MFCHKCGTQISDGAKFCHKCGTKIACEDVEPKISDDLEEASSLAPNPTNKQEGEYLEPNIANEQQGDCSDQSSKKDSLNEEEPSKLQTWWSDCSGVKKTFVVLGGVLLLFILIAFLVEFWGIIFFALMIGGFVLTLTTGSEKEKIETRKTIVQMVIGLIIILLITFIIVQKPDFITNILQPGASVRSAYLSEYSETVTIEDAFDRFFENGKWSTYKENGYSYVVFTGVCEYLEERADVKITFKITGEKFLVDSLDVNGMTQNKLILYGLLSKVYERY